MGLVSNTILIKSSRGLEFHSPARSPTKSGNGDEGHRTFREVLLHFLSLLSFKIRVISFHFSTVRITSGHI